MMQWYIHILNAAIILDLHCLPQVKYNHHLLGGR